MDIDRLQDKDEIPREKDDVIEAVEQALEDADRDVGEDDPETPEWDGTDSAIVPDQDAAEFEENPAGVHISYTLHPEEIRSVLRLSPTFRYSQRKMVVQTILFFVLFLFFLITYVTAQSPRTEQLVITLVCAAMMGFVWLAPEMQLRTLSKRQATDETVNVEIFPDVIKLGEGEGYWEIPLDGTSLFQEKYGLLIITTPDRKCVAFPIRSIEPALFPDVVAMLTVGTAEGGNF